MGCAFCNHLAVRGATDSLNRGKCGKRYWLAVLKKGGTTMKTIFLILALLLGLAIAVAAIMNNEVVTVNYLFGQINLTLFMLILGSAFAGALFMGLLGIFRSIGNYMNSQGDRKLKKDLLHQVKELEDEKKKMQEELSRQQKEREDVAAKAYAALDDEKKKLEAELKKTAERP
jgi:uncharacterized integral membrane protein